MAARVTIERILRDDDDDAGQSIRDWKIESEANFITIRVKHGTGFIMMRPADVETFIDDLRRAQDAAKDLATETHT